MNDRLAGLAFLAMQAAASWRTLSTQHVDTWEVGWAVAGAVDRQGSLCAASTAGCQTAAAAGGHHASPRHASGSGRSSSLVLMWRMHSKPAVVHPARHPQALYNAWLLSMVMTVVLVADSNDEEEWLPKRRPLLAVLRAAAAFSPVFREHARLMRVGWGGVGWGGGSRGRSGWSHTLRWDAHVLLSAQARQRLRRLPRRSTWPPACLPACHRSAACCRMSRLR